MAGEIVQRRVQRKQLTTGRYDLVDRLVERDRAHAVATSLGGVPPMLPQAERQNWHYAERRLLTRPETWLPDLRRRRRFHPAL
jgi:hypothetical protein